uniref:(northern house mosquito) hypothetical protein n=1 Tax=Culex pipiens TaxID=7175 RepID=A0A8D8HXS4_CULPI
MQIFQMCTHLHFFSRCFVCIQLLLLYIVHALVRDCDWRMCSVRALESESDSDLKACALDVASGSGSPICRFDKEFLARSFYKRVTLFFFLLQIEVMNGFHVTFFRRRCESC